MGQYVIEGMGFGSGDEDLVVPVFFARVEIREDREQEFGILHRTANRFADDLKTENLDMDLGKKFHDFSVSLQLFHFN